MVGKSSRETAESATTFVLHRLTTLSAPVPLFHPLLHIVYDEEAAATP